MMTSDLWTGLHMAVFNGTVSVVGPERTQSLQDDLVGMRGGSQSWEHWFDWWAEDVLTL